MLFFFDRNGATKGFFQGSNKAPVGSGWHTRAQGRRVVHDDAGETRRLGEFSSTIGVS